MEEKVDQNARAQSLAHIRAFSEIETENISHKPRFGLFTKPPPLAVHDPYKNPVTDYRKSETTRGNEKNILNNKMKQGNNEDVLFQVPSYITIGDTYQDPNKLKKYGYHNGICERPKTITAWRTTDVNKRKMMPPFPYMAEPTKSNVNLMMPRRDEERAKEMAKRRFASSVGKRGNNFNRFQNYMPEPYDRAKEKERQG